MKKIKKTLLSVTFCLFAVISVFFVFDLSANAFSEGSGTIDDPYLIYTVDDLLELENYRNSSVYFEQADDIDLDSVKWNSFYFYGNYNGNGFSIENMSSTGGLFRKNLGTIKNVKMQNVDICKTIDSYWGGSNYLPGSICVGAIANDNEGIIENCYVVSGSIRTQYFNSENVEDNYYNIGGIAGISSGTIKNCVNSADITVYGSFKTTVGGICGSGEVVDHCLNTGDVYAYVKTTTFFYDGFCWVEAAGVSVSAKIYDSANTGNIMATGAITFCPPIVGANGYYNYINNDAYFVGGDIMSKSYCSSAVECITKIPNDHINFSSSDYTRIEEDNVSITDKETILYMWSDILNLKKPYIPYTMKISGETERYAYVGGVGAFEAGDAYGTNVLLYFSPGTTDYTGFDIEWKSSDTDIFTVNGNLSQISGRNYICTCSIYAKKNGKAVLSAELPDGASVSINIQVVTPLQYDIKYSSDVYFSGGGFYSELSGLSDSVDFYFSFKNMVSDLLSDKFGEVLAPINPITITATIDTDELSFSRNYFLDTYTFTTDVLNAGRSVDDLIMLFPNNFNMDRDQKKYTIKITVTSNSFPTFTEEYQFSINKVNTIIDKHVEFVSKNIVYKTSKKNIYGNHIVELKNDKEYVWSKYTTLDFENYSQIVFADLMIGLLNVDQCQLSSPVPAIISEWVGNYEKMLGGISDIIDEEYADKFDLSETNVDKLLKKSKYSIEPSGVDDELRDTIVDLLGKKHSDTVNKVFAAVDKTSQIIDFIHLGENVLKDIIDWGNKITLYNAYTDATKEFKAVISRLADVIPDSERGMKDAVNDYINYDSGLGGQVSEVIESFSGAIGHMTLDVFNTCIGKDMVKYLVTNLINWVGSSIKIGGKLLSATSYFSAVQTGLGAISTGVTLGLCLSDILCDSADKSKEMSKAIYMSKYTPYIIETLNYFENKMLSDQTEEAIRVFENAVALHKAAQSYVLEHTINSCKIKADSIIIKLFNKDDWQGLISDMTYHKNQINNLKCHEETSQYGSIISKSKVIIVECPVDITVYDSDGVEVLQIKNNSLVASDEKFYAVIADTSKYISVPSDQNYKIKITAYDGGEMDYSVCEYDCDLGCSRKIITRDISLAMGKEFIGTIVKQSDEPASRFALSVDGEIIGITEDISVSQNVPSVNSYFYGYIKDLYTRPYTNSKYQYMGDKGLLYTLIKPYLVTDIDSSGRVKLRNSLYSLRGGIGSNNNPYLSYYFFGNAFTDAKAVLNHYRATYGVDLNRIETVSLSSGDYEINIFKTILGLIDLLYLPEDSYNYSSEEYKQYLVEELGMSIKQFDYMNNDDIEIMQQLALWYLIQSDEKNLTTPTLAHISRYPADRLIVNGDNDFSDSYRISVMNEFYTKLILKAIENGENLEFNNNSIGYTDTLKHFNKDTITEIHKVNGESANPDIVNPYRHYYQIGPIEIVSDESIPLDELELFDAMGEKIERRYEFAENSYVLTYNVYDEDFRSVSQFSPGKKYYIRLFQTFVKDSPIASENFVLYDANCIKLRISDSYYKSSAKYISASDTEQDLVKVSKQLISCSDELFISTHSLISVEEKEATCIQEGYRIYQCSDEGCSYEYRYEIAKTEHNPEVVEAIAATCDADGRTEGLVCNCCKTELVISETVPALGHSEVYYSAIESTCKKNGSSAGSYCQICNSMMKKSEILPQKDHNYKNVVKSDYLKSNATCTSAAKYFVSCSECGEPGLSVFSYGNPLGHLMGDPLLTEAATCTENGISKKICSRCDHIIYFEIPAKGHSEVIDKAVNSTCTETGLTEGKYCKDCGGIIVAQTVVPATGHTFTEKIIDSSHFVSSATTQSPAIYKYDCANCDEISDELTFTYGEKLNALGKPEKITTVQNTSAIKLTWTPVEGATGYKVYQMVGGQWKALGNTSKTTAIIGNLEAGTKYSFAVKAGAIIDGKVVWSTTYTTINTTTQTIKPEKVSAAQNTSAIKLSWTACPGATGYRIFYKSGNSWKICLNATTATSHTFTNLKAGAKFTFAVRPYIITDSGVVWSSYTEFMTATKPANVSAKVASTSKGKVTLTWNAVSGVDGYQVYYKTGNGSYKLYKTYSGVQNLTFSNLKAGTKYTFAVRAGIRTSGGNIYGGYNAATVTVK